MASAATRPAAPTRVGRHAARLTSARACRGLAISAASNEASALVVSFNMSYTAPSIDHALARITEPAAASRAAPPNASTAR